MAKPPEPQPRAVDCLDVSGWMQAQQKQYAEQMAQRHQEEEMVRRQQEAYAYQQQQAAEYNRRQQQVGLSPQAMVSDSGFRVCCEEQI
jgi:hypothetical protein